MYESFYGFKEKPFKLLPDPDYLFMSKAHEDAYINLEYAISENKGFVVITGEIGSGKTTLINFLLRKIPQDINVAIITHTDVSPSQFVKMMCLEYELEVFGMDKAEMLQVFYDFLLKQFSMGNRVVLIVDEAQNLPPKTMEEIRMLSNLESEKEHLLQIILVGQPELRYKLQQRGLEQFTQRITVYCHIEGLSREEVAEYIRHRLEVAGAPDPHMFQPGAIETIHKYSDGIPRIINILCDTALVYAFADGVKVIGKDLMDSVIEDRKESGIFYPKDEGVQQIELPGGDDQQKLAHGFERRLQNLESRLKLMEKMLGSLDQRLSNLALRKAHEETVFVDLFKMLKESMESRMRLILRLIRMGEKIRWFEEDRDN